MAIKEEFKKAAEDVQKLPAKPGNDTLLALYSLYKQATEGDATGKRPGMLDMKGRAKFDAWVARKGITKEQAMEGYVSLVKTLLA